MITAISKEKNYKTDITGESASITMDMPVASGGSGGALVPFELLLSGFASCLNITIRMLLDKRGVSYRQVKVSADEDRNKKPGAMIISWQAEIEGDIPEEDKRKYIARAFEKCPVHNALAGNIEFAKRE